MESSDARTPRTSVSGPGTDAAAASATHFASATAVERVSPGRYLGHMDRAWWIIHGPNGGYVAAMVLRAIVAEVADPARRPRSLTVHYLRPPTEGPVLVEVVVERSGRSVSNVSARLFQDDRLLVIALAALGADRPGPVAFDEGDGLPLLADGSQVPSPERTPSAEVDPGRDVPMRAHYDMRWVLGALPFHPPADEVDRRALAGGWLRLAERQPTDEVVLTAMTDAWLPPLFSRIDEIVAVPTVDLTIHFRALPEDPFDFCFVEFSSPLVRDGHLVEHGRILSRSGVLLAESRQLAVVA